MCGGRGFALALACLLGAAGPAGAAQFHVEAETVGDAYQLVRSDGELLNRRRLHQLVGFGAYDLLGDGGYKLSAQTLFRFDADFGLTDEEQDAVRGLRREQLTIQTAFVDGARLGGLLDFRLGRFLHADPIDYLYLDGLVATVHLPFHLGVEVQAGVEADNDLGSITSSQLELDGTRWLETPEGARQRVDRAKVAIGAALVTSDLKWTRARLGYRRILSGRKVAQEKVGAALNQRIGERVHVDAVTSWDLYNQTLDQLRAGVRWRPTEAWEVEGQLVHLVPTWDAESIFNVFLVSPLNDLNTRARFYMRRDRWVYGGGMLRMFSNGPGESKDPTRPEPKVDTSVSAWGAMAGYHHGLGERGWLTADVAHEDGYGGSRTLLDLGARYAVVPRVFEIDGRLTGIAFADELQKELKAAGGGYQVGARYLIDTRAALQAMVEHNFNRIHRSQLRVMIVADLGFFL